MKIPRESAAVAESSRRRARVGCGGRGFEDLATATRKGFAILPGVPGHARRLALSWLHGARGPIESGRGSRECGRLH
jgi:hypothetical protein